MKQNKRNKPFYKQFLRLRKNIQDRPKLFKFKNKQKTFNDPIKTVFLFVRCSFEV